MYTGSLLSDNGEALILKDASNTIIDTANGNGGAWPAGTLTTASNHGTMERMNSNADSDYLWLTNVNPSTWTKHDIAGNIIHGTPGASNWGYGVTQTPSPTATSTATPTSTSTRTPTSLPFGIGTVVINEVAWMGSAASSSDEWIELYNTTGALIDLTGWEIHAATSATVSTIIKFNSSTCTNGCLIPAHGYFLLERNDNAVKNVDADLIFAWSLLSNSGAIMLLCSPYNVSSNTCNTNSLSVPIDEANRNGGAWPAGSASTYGSMERKFFNSDADTNWFTFAGTTAVPPCTQGHDAGWNGTTASANLIKGTPKCANWAVNVTATPRATYTPTRTPTPVPQPAPVLVLNEFLARPGHDFNNDGLVNTYDEFIEVINAGLVDVNLANYKLDDEKDLGSPPFSLPSKTLKPGEIAVFYGSQTGISLSDAGDTVRLLKASNNTVVDAYTYPILKSLDISYCRLTDGYGDWVPRCFPTPGLPNALAGSLPSLPGAPSGSACLLPDTTPLEFVQAECLDTGLDMWNPAFWDTPDEGSDVSFSEHFGKWTVIYQ